MYFGLAPLPFTWVCVEEPFAAPEPDKRKVACLRHANPEAVTCVMLHVSVTLICRHHNMLGQGTPHDPCSL